MTVEDRSVTVGIVVDGQKGRVWMRDEGPGLWRNSQAAIWERFRRAKGIEIQRGIGIGRGLGDICRTLIERRHG